MITIYHIIIVGLLSCLVMDLWQRLLKLTYGINPSDWKIIGRWFIYLVLKQKIYNPNIENESAYNNELMIGWIFHYFIGVVYSFGFYFMEYYNVFEATLIDGLIFGLVTLVIPWFFMLPGGKRFSSYENTPSIIYKFFISLESFSYWYRNRFII